MSAADPAPRLPEHDLLRPEPDHDWARQHLADIERARKENGQ